MERREDRGRRWGRAWRIADVLPVSTGAVYGAARLRPEGPAAARAAAGSPAQVRVRLQVDAEATSGDLAALRDPLDAVERLRAHGRVVLGAVSAPARGASVREEAPYARLFP